jgi:mannose-6-phosphate isomerase-like protein (cupin superfamily)
LTHGRIYDPVQKAWGTQQPLLRDDTIHVDKIDVRPGGYCSVHFHERKHNIFQVLRGRMLVLTFDGALKLIRTDDLCVAGHCCVRAGWHHQFWSQGGCVAQEVYYGTQDGNLRVFESDIMRMSGLEQGGLALTLDALPSLLEPAHA